MRLPCPPLWGTFLLNAPFLCVCHLALLACLSSCWSGQHKVASLRSTSFRRATCYLGNSAFPRVVPWDFLLLFPVSNNLSRPSLVQWQFFSRSKQECLQHHFFSPDGLTYLPPCLLTNPWALGSTFRYFKTVISTFKYILPNTWNTFTISAGNIATVPLSTGDLS